GHEATRTRLVERLHGAEYGVAAVDAVDDDAEGVHIHDFMEGAPLDLHLLIDAVEVLLAPDDASADSHLVEALADALLDFLDDAEVVAPQLAHGFLDVAGPHGVQGGKAEIFQFDSNRVDAEAVGDGGVDVEGFGGDAAAFFSVQRTQGAHVVQAVGQLDQDHPDVARHRQGHFLEIFRLGFGFGAKFDLGQFADAVHQFRDGFAKLLGQGFLGNAGVLDHIMK